MRPQKNWKMGARGPYSQPRRRWAMVFYKFEIELGRIIVDGVTERDYYINTWLGGREIGRGYSVWLEHIQTPLQSSSN